MQRHQCGIPVPSRMVEPFNRRSLVGTCMVVGGRDLPTANTHQMWHKQEINDQQEKERTNLPVFLIPLLPTGQRWTDRECLIGRVKLLCPTLLMLRQTTQLISPPALSSMWGKLWAEHSGNTSVSPITTFYVVLCWEVGGFCLNRKFHDS